MRFDTIKLSELAEIQTGPFGSQLHKEDYVVNGTPIVTVEHLGNRKFTEQNLPCVSDKDKERLKKYKLKTGDIVFSRVGSVDRCSYVSAEYEGWMFSGRCLRVRPCEILNSEYLYYFFSLKETKQFVRNIATGATMPSINTKFMGEVPIRVPSMEAQNKIASILWMIDDKIELNEKINNNLSPHPCNARIVAIARKHRRCFRVYKQLKGRRRKHQARRTLVLVKERSAYPQVCAIHE